VKILCHIPFSVHYQHKHFKISFDVHITSSADVEMFLISTVMSSESEEEIISVKLLFHVKSPL
jgi:hypothetical protein